MSNNVSSSASLHAMLEYIVSLAIVNNKVTQAHIVMPLSELLKEQDGNRLLKLVPNADSIGLRVNISTSWEDLNALPEEDELKIDAKEPEEDPNTEVEEPKRGNTGKNSKGH